MNSDTLIQVLLSLPPGNAGRFRAADLATSSFFSTCDPPGGKLGSGGGTVHLLVEAWRADPRGLSFQCWLDDSRKLLIHGGGQSRRLPAYAALGKPFIPMPVMRHSWGQHLDQSLLDLQLDPYRRILDHASRTHAAMVASGDVLLRFGRELPPFPDVDVLVLGMQVSPEVASHFGVFFIPPGRSDGLAFMLQKPEPGRIRELSVHYSFLVDTGMWLFSPRALAVLMERCGWDVEAMACRTATRECYELYGQFGLALGGRPTLDDPLVRSLSCAVVALPEPEFYHFGTSRQLIESVWALQTRNARGAVVFAERACPDQVVQNADFDPPERRDLNHTLWIENAAVPASWCLAHDHVITGAPENNWQLALEPGVCLDFIPVGEADWCVRPYGIDDIFAGPIGAESTRWFGDSAALWFAARGIAWDSHPINQVAAAGEIQPAGNLQAQAACASLASLQGAPGVRAPQSLVSDASRWFDPSIAVDDAQVVAVGVFPEADLYTAPLFPVMAREDLDAPFMEWLVAGRPASSPDQARRWCALPRLSAEAIIRQVNLGRLEAQRVRFRHRAIGRLHRNSRVNVFYRLDLADTARLYAAGPDPLPPVSPLAGEDPMACVHEHMWRAAVLGHRGETGVEAEEQRAFGCLRQAILGAIRREPARPVRTVMADQIVWGRAPIRLDLAGGWTDTPPYCLRHGGTVTNLAVNLNGQPPIQVYIKPAVEREIVIRSIDLGVEERIRSYEQLDNLGQIGSAFSLAKGALALAGFLPRFHADGGFASLDRQLDDFGCGLELSLMVAIPAGSGLGTSSILAATLLQSLGDACGLGWDVRAVIARTMALEQLLTTGGGWQDQVGGILRGVKLIQTAPGLDQAVTVRWLPETLFAEPYANRRILLYYTGLTRLARNILQEIVRGMFLNDSARLAVLRAIGENAVVTADAIQRGDCDGLCEGVRRSWDLNQRLDAGTNPPAVQAILESVAAELAAAKLLGAGGGGYMLMLARDDQAGERIRRALLAHPPNPRARFVDLAVSRTGLEVTRS